MVRPVQYITCIYSHNRTEHDSENESIPEGFEPWEPTVPLRRTRTVVKPKYEEVDEAEPELAWHPPRMTWFRDECTGAGSAGAFIEPVVRHHARRTHIEVIGADLSASIVFLCLRDPNTELSQFLTERVLGRPRWARERSKYGPPRETIARLEPSILYADKMVPIPGMNAPRGGGESQLAARRCLTLMQFNSGELHCPS
jgi:hypothetical protein